MEQLVAREAHNLEVTGSSPVPATNLFSRWWLEYGLTSLAKRFNVSNSTMHYILKNVTYK